jgi:hypothetical protein
LNPRLRKVLLNPLIKSGIVRRLELIHEMNVLTLIIAHIYYADVLIIV